MDDMASLLRPEGDGQATNTLGNNDGLDGKNNVDVGIAETPHPAQVFSECQARYRGSHGNKMSSTPGRTGAAAINTEMGSTEECHEPDYEDKWLAWAKSQFVEIAGEDKEIDYNEFKVALGIKNSFFAERFFACFDKDNSGTVLQQEFLDGLHMMTKGDSSQKLKFLFDIYDVDGSGAIGREEIKIMLDSCVEESAMHLRGEDLDLLTDILFEDADNDNSGDITFDELVGQLRKYPGVIDNLTLSASNWLQSQPPKIKQKKSVGRHFNLSYIQSYIQNNTSWVVFMCAYLFINLGLGSIAVYTHRDSSAAFIIASVCGICAFFNSAVKVLLPHRLLTWLRSTRAGHYLPLDESIEFHKLVGWTIVALGMIHSVLYLIHIAIVKHELSLVNVTEALKNNETLSHLLEVTWSEWLFTLKAGVGWVGPGFAYPSGMLLFMVLAMMSFATVPCVRRNGYFQVFYWTHLLYVVYLVFLMLHTPPRWMVFFIVPSLFFITELILKSKGCAVAKYGRVYITEVNLLPSKVTHLMIARPPNFAYKPGDWVSINIPAVAGQEWHPFTISSAPEREDSIWLHVRSVGYWTDKVFEYFRDYQTPEPKATDHRDNGVGAHGTFEEPCAQHYNSSRKTKQNINGRRKSKPVNVEIFIDGPYGMSTMEIFQTEHAVLIASGIGVTPYASVLQSIAHRYASTHNKCPGCSHVWSSLENNAYMKMKKVDFIWINRNQRSFEWFVSLLASLELDGSTYEGFNSFLEMQLYMTAALSKNDMKGVGLQMAMELLHKRENRDVLTGLKTRTQPGRPNWGEVFSKIQREKKGRVTVSFCGSPLIAKDIKRQCEIFGFKFTKEYF